MVSTPLGESLKSVSQVVNNCKLGEKKNVNVPGYLPTLSIRSPELGTCMEVCQGIVGGYTGGQALDQVFVE